MFLVSNVLLGMANARLNNLFSDELDNFKRACVLNLHKMWQNYKSATSIACCVGSMLTQHCVMLMSWCEAMLCRHQVDL